MSPQSERVSDLFRIELIEPNLEATRETLIADIVGVAARTGLVSEPAELLSSLLAREAVSPTSLEGQFAFLHPKNHVPGRFRDSFLVLARTPEKIIFGLDKDSLTDIFFLSCCEERDTELRAMARLFRIIKNTDVLAALRTAPDALAMHRSLVDCETRTLEKDKLK